MFYLVPTCKFISRDRFLKQSSNIIETTEIKGEFLTFYLSYTYSKALPVIFFSKVNITCHDVMFLPMKIYHFLHVLNR